MKHKSDDYKFNAVDYYLTEDKSQKEVCKINTFHFLKSVDFSSYVGKKKWHIFKNFQFLPS